MISRKRSVLKKKELTAEEKEAIKIKARRQFKAGCRLVINNIHWYTAEELQRETLSIEESQHILTARSIKNLLSFKDKILLRKHSSLRTEKEKMYLFLLMSNTKLFRLYPEEVKIAVAGHIYHGFFEADKMLTREGDESTMMCLLISGEIQLFENSFDPILNTKTMKYVKTDGPGTVFGEMDILNNTPRKYTRFTSTPIEFLYITKKDLNEVLDQTVRNVWNTIREYISQIPYFIQYNMEDIQEVMITSKILEFDAEEVILGNGIGNYGWTHIIVEGKCRLIETLMIIPDRKATGTSYKLYSGEISSNLPPNVEIHYMQICTMKYGSTFNVGENFENRTVVSITPVKCFCIPNYLLLKRNVWILLKEQLNKHIPSTQQVFKEYINHQKWLKYRQDLQNDILAKHYIPSYNTIENLSPTYAIIPDKSTNQYF